MEGGKKGNGPTTECTNLLSSILVVVSSSHHLREGSWMDVTFRASSFASPLTSYLVLLQREVTANHDAQSGPEFPTPRIVLPHCLSHPPGADHCF